ncbi:MAG: MFS transporter [Desulfobacterales bacterium]|nr:MFS transporter [Desulfobacterales bacterium]
MRFKDDPMYRFLIGLTIASAIGLQGWRTLFNNFAVEVAGLNGAQVGLIQSVREIPGFLALLAIYMMLFIREHRLSALSILFLGLGVGLTGFLPTFSGVVFTTLVMSFGFHYFETTNQSLTLQYFDRNTAPIVFGRQRSYAAATNIGIGAVIYLLAAAMSYRQIYFLMGMLLMAMALWGFRQKPTRKNLPPQHKRMILRRPYSLFYVLTFLSGARRQIFIAFAVFLMVERFAFSVQEITLLFILNNVINYFVSPMIGKAIVRYGERWVLTLEYASLVLIFLAYAVADTKLMVAALYILDHIFFNFAIAIRTYFQKIADPRDIAPSMAVGFTINHIAAVILPAAGGLLWMIDYRLTFVGGAILAFCSLVAVQCIPSSLVRAHKPPR